MMTDESLYSSSRRFSVTRSYHFEAAHFLPFVPKGHKCRRVHGHNYRIDISVSGHLDACGFVIDFFDLDAIMSPLIASLDHRTLNKIDGLENPTAELIAEWFSNKLWQAGLHSRFRSVVRVYETADACAEYSAP
jgi:6-pyruvoyltetrahydropterin/6-carboxytetrahydropterin synthase